MKKITNLTLSQTPAKFKKDDGQSVDYMQYSLLIDGREVLVKPVNAVAKVRLVDAFDEVDESTPF